ncbi:MAG: ABC transporter ATP-binding protein [Pseudomonadota bacterium]
MAAEAIVAAEGLSVAYRGDAADVMALRDVDLAIHEGEIVGLIGDAGCGKSTAALALLGLVRPPGQVVAGRVTFRGQDLLALDPEALRAIRGRDIGLIVQNPRASLSPLHMVGRQIGTVYRAHNPASAAAAEAHAIDMLRRVGINDPERRIFAFPHEISGGMAQRVLIAMALSSRPQLLIADEPTSGLDVTIQAQFLDQMWRTGRDTGSAVLLVTQDLGIVANYCDRVVVMQDGMIVDQAPVAEFFRAPRHPYSRAILALQRDDAANEVVPAEAAPSVPLIEVRHLAKRFPLRGSTAQIQAVDDVSFTIAAGETLGLVGESGSGKTTVGRCLLRLTEPDAGDIAYRGQPFARMGADAVRRLRAKLQIVFQDPFDSLNPRWTVGEVLDEPLRLHSGLPAVGRAARRRELLALVGLDPALATRRPRVLSAGAQQRVAIARAIASEPELIVLDEPTSALAPAARASFIALLKDLQTRLGLSYLFISHDLTTVRYLSHRVAVMYLSQIVEIGTREQIFGAPRHPYSRALLSAHLSPDPTDRRVDRPPSASLQGEIPSPINLPLGCYLYGRCPDQLAACATLPQALLPLDDGRQVRCWRVTSPATDDGNRLTLEAR